MAVIPPEQQHRARPSSVQLLIGPANSAGQAHAWARAAELHCPGVRARSLALRRRFGFPADETVDLATYHSPEWGQARERDILENVTHLVAESGRPMTGRLYGSYPEPELLVFAQAGIAAALLSHGSDTRIPSLHAERERWSPFRDPTWEQTPRLEEGARQRVSLFTEHEGHIFVSTPDLLDDLPDATWCPVVVDLDAWHTDTPAFERDRPVVVHIPSDPQLKGSEFIEPVLRRLHDAAVIDYHPHQSLTAAEMPAAYRDADIIVDQMTLGIYGVAACEGMAAGRVVVSHVADRVRARVKGRTGHDLPVLEADPDSLEEVLAEVVADRDRASAVALRGPEFVREVHDGRLSAVAMTDFLVGAGP